MANDAPGSAPYHDPTVVNGPRADGGQVPPERSATMLLRGILVDVACLIGQQLAMFRQEIRTDIRKGKTAVVLLAVGAGMAFVGGLLLLLMLPLLLHWAVPDLPLWACFGLLGGGVLVLGGALVYVGYRKIAAMDLLANPAVHALKENLQWITKVK